MTYVHCLFFTTQAYEDVLNMIFKSEESALKFRESKRYTDKDFYLNSYVKKVEVHD
jgi:cobyric acid synthase